jgi:tetratricopeptide (TPR) repeat protein/TolB-like protein
MSAGFSIASFAGEEKQAAGRMPLCILPLENATGNPDWSHWSHAFQYMLMFQLNDCKSLRIIPEESMRFGIRQAKVDTEDAITREQALRIGKELEVTRVIWGRFERQDEIWEVTVRIGKVVDQTVAKELTAKGRAWNAVVDSLESQLLAELEAKPGQLHRDKPSLRWATSPDALECYSQAHADSSLAGQREKMQRAVTLDPKFVQAYIGLAVTLGKAGNLDAARKAIEQALTLEPDEPTAHDVLGCVLLAQNDTEGGAAELRKAVKLDPDQFDANSRLGQIYADRGELDQALAACKAAKQANPFDCGASAGLAQVYALKGDAASARRELQDAERFAPANNLEANMIGFCYELLHDPYSALQYYRQFILANDKLGLNPDVVNQVEKKVLELEARQAPRYVTNAMPQDLTPQELAKALRAKLTSEEAALIADPFESTPAMRAWAEKLTRGLTNDFDKAQALFQGIMQHFQFGEVLSFHGAREVFAKMDDKTAAFNCLEGAQLYVALGRDMGLKTFMTQVDRDFKDDVVLHSCAAVFLQTNALLVDPSYQWFGVPHKQITVLDDVQATAITFSAAGDLPEKSQLPRVQIAEKIYPDCEFLLFIHINTLFELGQWEEARKLIPALEKVNPDGWRLAYAKGMLAAQDRQDKPALSLFTKANQIYPDNGSIHFNLAAELAKNGRLAEARDEYQAALSCPRLDSEQRDNSLQVIAAINERISRPATAAVSTNAEPPFNPPK